MIKYNPTFVTSAKAHPKIEEFFKRFITMMNGSMDELRYGNYNCKSENLNKLISKPKLLNEKPLIVKAFRKIFKKFLPSLEFLAIFLQSLLKFCYNMGQN